MNAREDREVRCDVCGKPRGRLRRVSRNYGKGRSLLVVEDVPIISCPHCGESCLSAETALELDRIRENSRKYSVKREVSVAQFGEPNAA